MGKREEIADIILDMKRHGFAQLRKTTHGWLFGFQEFRMTVPHNVVDSGDQDVWQKVQKDWAKVKAEVLGANPGLKLKSISRRGDRPTDVERIQVVENIEDILNGGTAGADAGVVSPAGAGSIPAPPAITDAGERSEPGIATPALDGSTPSAGTTLSSQKEETIVTVKRNKRGRRFPAPWTCPKCEETFKVQGRHFKACKGKGAAIVKPGRNKKSAPTPEVAVTNGHGTIETFQLALTAYTKASADLLVFVKHLQGEVQLYRRENTELRQFKQRASALFEPASRVPRRG